MSRQPLKQKVSEKYLRQDNSREQMNKKVPQHLILSNQSSLEKPVGKHMAEEEKGSTKLDGVENQAKTKRSMKLSAIRSRRADHFIVPKSLDVRPLNTDALAREGSSTTRACQHMRTTCTNGSQGYVSQATKNKVERIKKDRKRSVIGSLASILGPEERSGDLGLTVEREFSVRLTPRKKSADTPATDASDCLDLQKVRERQRKTLAMRRRRCGEKARTVDQSMGIPVSLTSIAPKDRVRSTSGRKVTSSAVVAIATSGTSSPSLEIRKRSNTKKGVVSIAVKPEKENQQSIATKTRTLRNGKQINFNETKLREEIRSRLRKSQQKFETFSASLASTKPKPTPTRKVTSTLGTSTMSVEATRALIKKSHFPPIASTSTTGLPKLKCKARSGRSAWKRIPETIPEDRTLDFGKVEVTKKARPKSKRSSLANKKISSKGKTSTCPQSPKKAKASFYPRSPKSSPGRNKRRFRVVTPHPIECAGASKDGHGGLCMTFPVKSAHGGNPLQKIQGLMLVQ